MPTHNFRLSCLVTMVTILLGSHISFTSARHTEKRDAGLEMCKLHPRNCPGGLLLKREESLINRLRRIFPNDVYSGTNPNANPTNNNDRSETAFVLEDDDGDIPSGSIDILPNSLSSSSASASSLNDLGSYPAAPVERRGSRDVVERPMARLLDMLRSYRARQQQHQQQQLQQQSSYRKRKV